jgi:eukaryotic-like serine/threonine-protein kinase
MTERRTMGRYDLERVLGKGGMGVVWLAKDPVLDRPVALKHLREDLVLTPDQRGDLFARMRVEARAAAHLTHPNVVTLHDFGEDDALGPWLVFEFVEGPSLRDELKRGPMPVPRLVQATRDLVEALAYAHERNVLHRDVKPENVLVSPTGMKLADFGVARLPDVQMTATGVLIGTPAYGAPESLRRAEFTPASDQFSLGVMLWELMKGQRPESLDESSLPTQVASRRLDATSPSTDLPTLPTVGESAAERVLLRAMSPRPEHRFPSVRALGEAFVRALDPAMALTAMHSLPPVAAGASSKERRNQNVALAVALVLLVALAFAGRIEAFMASVRGAPIDAGAAPAAPRKATPFKKVAPRENPGDTPRVTAGSAAPAAVPAPGSQGAGTEPPASPAP